MQDNLSNSMEEHGMQPGIVSNDELENFNYQETINEHMLIKTVADY